MSAVKDGAETRNVDEVDPYLETVVRNAAGRQPEPKAPVKKMTTAKQIGAKGKAGASKTVPTPGVNAEEVPASTLADALDEDGLMARVEAKLKAGKSIPSRSVTIRMPGDLYEKLTKQAWEIGERSLSRFVITILEEATQR